MRPTTRYSLIDPRPDNQPALLARNRQALATKVDGINLEAQFELNDGGGLLWLTDDSPYDEGLHVYLLGPNDTIKDALEAGVFFGLGGPGVLKIKKTGEDWVEFAFFLNGALYRLEIAQKARLRLPLPTGWRYKHRFSKHQLRVDEARTSEANV